MNRYKAGLLWAIQSTEVQDFEGNEGDRDKGTEGQRDHRVTHSSRSIPLCLCPSVPSYGNISSNARPYTRFARPYPPPRLLVKNSIISPEFTSRTLGPPGVS